MPPNMPSTHQHTIFQISDTAITVDFGNSVNEDINRIVLRFFKNIRANPFIGFIEAVPSYSSLTIYYDLLQLRKIVPGDLSVSEWVKETVSSFIPAEEVGPDEGAISIEIPVCYDPEYATDIKLVAKTLDLSIEELIEIHLSRTYRVHMLGFLPGFAYMGELDKRIYIPRKKQPVPVISGSVGIVGLQTGIYPMNSPGGWSIIGRTPLTLFDVHKDKITLLNAGDKVKFIAITKYEFENY